MLKEVCVRLSVVAFVCCLSITAHAMADQRSHVSVPAGDLTTGLEMLARQSGAEIVYQADQLKGLRTQGVSGDLSPKEAVTKLLIGTPLQLRMDATGAMLIARTDLLSIAPSAIGSDGAQEGKGSASGDFRLAQVDQTSIGPQVASGEHSAKVQKTDSLEEVIVTGSRLPRTEHDTAQDVKVYTREQITASGQTTMADFLNTLPDVSLSSSESAFQNFAGTTTVQLHGLPVGSTLTLINGRRVEASGSVQGQFFDLGNIPVSAVERVEVLSEGASAVYGSDAIGGVVNVVLRSKVDGVEVSAKYGAASGMHDTTANLAAGHEWGALSGAIIATYEDRTTLLGSERDITANADYRRFGGTDGRVAYCNPGTVFSINGSPLPGLGNATYAAVPAGFTGTPTIAEFSGTAGTQNLCSPNALTSLIPASERASVLGELNYEFSNVRLFSEAMYSHVKNTVVGAPSPLFGIPSIGFSQFIVPADNPFNPFGESVGIAGLLTGSPPTTQVLVTDYYRFLVGAEGSLSHDWHWEAAAWESRDSSSWTEPFLSDYFGTPTVQNALNSTDPATAMNPFVDGPYGSPSLLASVNTLFGQTYSGKTDSVDFFFRGSPIHLPGGAVQVLLGGEFDRIGFAYDNSNSALGTPYDYHREVTAGYAEVKVPIIGSASADSSGDVLSIDLAGRWDHYSDFGNQTTPQVGLEWRPIPTLLFRGTYAKAFQAPNLNALFAPSGPGGEATVFDPKTGQTVVVPITTGGNPDLRPLTGHSTTYGVLYASDDAHGLRLSVTGWHISDDNSIQALNAQTVVDNEELFPGRVVRASEPNGPITALILTNVNFGSLNVDGIDYAAQASWATGLGTVTPSLTVTQTYRYSAALTPGSPPVDGTSMAQDSGNWAPRWKGAVTLAWKLRAFSALVDGRYVGRYQDYDSTREIGNFWLFDAHLRYSGPANSHDTPWLDGAYVEVGAVNLFNTLPQYSNYYGGSLGYDPTQADIRGRFVYGQVGWKW